MYAVIVTGGRQYRVAQGETLRVEKLVADIGAEVKLDQVLLVGEGDGVTVGAPLVAGALVTAKVVSHGRGEKIRTYNFKENRVSDHRVGYKAHNLDQVLDGDLDAVIRALVEGDRSGR